ncbi:MAG TPA: hypothetical protein GX404_06705 [Syntrophomonadaceae bacterium]|nr:hypothetical protein [Syntrophomonadaceae bacterium]
MTKRSFVIWTIALTVLFCLLLGLLNFIIDPLQYYRQASFYQPSFSEEQRYQAPALARNWDYDTIIIGSSMTENFIPTEVDKALDARTVKLSMSGCSAREEKLIIELALREKQPRRVIWGLDYGSLKGDIDRVRDETTPFPYYLYDDKWYNDYPYLFSKNTLRHTLEIISNELWGKEAEIQDPNYLNHWHSWATYGEEVLMQQWQEEKKQRQKVAMLYDQHDWSFAAMAKSFDVNIYPLIKEHPEVEYVIYFPPYSILRYKSLMLDDPQMIADELKVKAYIWEKLKDCPNVELYDFQADKSLTHKLDNYKDYSHHNIEYNELILQAIATRDPDYLLTEENVQEKIQSLREQIYLYEID